MTFSCEICSTRYSIGDDRVAGRSFRFRCKRCSELVVVKRADSPANRAPEPARVQPASGAVLSSPGPATEADEKVRLRIRFKAGTVEELVDRYGEDIEPDLIFIKTRDLRPVGQSLEVLFELQSGQPWLQGRCRVLWARKAEAELPQMRSGMALEIEEVTPETEPVFQDALIELAHRRHDGRGGDRRTM